MAVCTATWAQQSHDCEVNINTLTIDPGGSCAGVVTVADAMVTISGNVNVRIYGVTPAEDTTNRIVVNGGSTLNVTFDGVNINLIPTPNLGKTQFPAFSILNNSAVTLNLKGDNKLISNGSYAGLWVGSGNKVEINGPGKLVANGHGAKTGSITGGGAGIGGQRSETGGTIIINGGTIVATGGSYQGYGASGIGGGGGSSGGGAGGVIVINGGIVEAKGVLGGAGIGGGDDGGGVGNDITINDGSVTATGGNTGGAGIGGGGRSAGGKVVINGGTVEAIGGAVGGAGIGGGDAGDGGSVTINDGNVTATGVNGGSGIGGGEFRASGTLIIHGGTVAAKGGDGTQTSGGGGGAGIGSGNGARGAGGSITIDGGSITATGGAGGAGIGGGGGGSAGGSITIDGGTIITTGGIHNGYGGAGIGGGSSKGAGGTIAIGGGTITATGGADGAGIGGGAGANDGGKVTITGGSILAGSPSGVAIQSQPTDGEENVYLDTLVVDGISTVTQVDDFKIARVAKYGFNDVYTDANGKLYFYLPANSSCQEAVARLGDDDYSAACVRVDKDGNGDNTQPLSLGKPTPLFVSVASIPTLMQWALVLLIGALALVAAGALRRRGD